MSAPFEPVRTDQAPAAIGPYSQAVKAGGFAFLSGQIPLDPATGEMVAGDIDTQIARVFDNLAAVATAAGGSLHDCVKFTVFLTDLAHFARVNAAMEARLAAPYAARAAVQVAALPRGAEVEVEAVMRIP
ncbi:MAG: Rid family detoxifying hydrolase [Pseudomonadales bacterium]|jgi:reactive intermediate/imine deaminase|nr:Rid family detoxifying hydrolase [Pseudomonadales bacterium]